MTIPSTLTLPDVIYQQNINTLGERLHVCLNFRGISQTELAKGVGVTPQNIQAICSGKIQKSRHVNEIAAYLNVNPTWLATGKLSSGSHYATQITAVSQIPIIAWSTIENANYNLDEQINGVFDHGDLSYALKMTDDSMSPRFEQGDILLISKSTEAVVGDYIIVKILANNQYACRVLQSNEPLKLRAINPVYGIIEYSNTPFEILGIVKEVRSILKK